MLVGAAIGWIGLAWWLVPWDWLPGGKLIPVAPGEIFTAEQIDAAESFASTVRPLSWSSLVVSLALLCLLGFTRWGVRLSDAVTPRGARWLRVPFTVAAVLLVDRAVTLPFSLLVRAERLDRGLTRQSLTGWIRDQAVSLGVSWVITTIGLVLLIWLARRSPRWWFAWAGAAAAALTFAISFVYPVVVEPLFNSFTSLPEGSLRTEILALADEEGVPIEDVLVADASRRTTTLNAYVSGFGHSRRVVLYDNLVNDLPDDQIESVAAHELAHAKHNDVLLGTGLGALGAVVGVCALALLLDSRRVRDRSDTGGAADPRVVAVVIALIGIGGLLSAPLQNGVSRAIEARADRTALQATQDPAAFIELQRSLAVSSLSDPTPPVWAHWWWGSHPTTLQRIGMAKALFS